jgi:hypothetical protein
MNCIREKSRFDTTTQTNTLANWHLSMPVVHLLSSPSSTSKLFIFPHSPTSWHQLCRPKAILQTILGPGATDANAKLNFCIPYYPPLLM